MAVRIGLPDAAVLVPSMRASLCTKTLSVVHICSDVKAILGVPTVNVFPLFTPQQTF